MLHACAMIFPPAPSARVVIATPKRILSKITEYCVSAKKREREHRSIMFISTLKQPAVCAKSKTRKFLFQYQRLNMAA